LAVTTVADRIADAFPTGNYALSGLLRLLDIVETDAVDTAAVECVGEPRLLINPGFVNVHASTPETLLMLVMHELHHVLLGHTTLFPRTTPLQNFVFDAIINALISRMFPHPEYLRLLTDFYADDRFPECLLRPPAGWRPDRTAILPPGITHLPEPLRNAVADVYRGLYSDGGVSYDEIYEVLPHVVGAGDVGVVVLLGGHDEQGTDEAASRSPLLVEAIRPIVEQWPQPAPPIRGRSLADWLRDVRVTRRREPGNRAMLRRLIRQIADVDRDGRSFRIRGGESIAAASALPTMNRRTVVLRALGHEPLLHVATALQPWRVPRGQRVHVYVDVSGSLEHVRGGVYGAVLDCSSFVHPTVHLFSTAVADVTLAGLRRGVCRTTGGTEIACVAEHIKTSGTRRAVIVTDGWVGTPRGDHRSILARTRLGVCYVGEDANVRDLAAVANVTARLNLGVR
jgi:hypothetical protein